MPTKMSAGQFIWFSGKVQNLMILAITIKFPKAKKETETIFFG